MCNIEHMLSVSVTRPDIVLKLYQMMYDIDKIFEKHKIVYWIEGGTLLGAVRHNGIIPWDDDLDIKIDEMSEKLIVNIIPDLDQLGYEITSMFFGYKIYPKDGKKIDGYKHRYPGLDIFVTKLVDGYYDYKYQVPATIAKCKFRNNDLYPIKDYKFGDIMVKGPNNPIPFLNDCYGNNWNDEMYKDYDHENEIVYHKEIVPLLVSDKVAAKPTGPIIKW